MIAGHRVGHYSAEGKLLTPLTKKQIKAVEKTLRGKVQKQTFPLNLQIPQTTRDSHFSTASRLLTFETGHFICSQKRTFLLANDTSGSPTIGRTIAACLLSAQGAFAEDAIARGLRAMETEEQAAFVMAFQAEATGLEGPYLRPLSFEGGA